VDVDRGELVRRRLEVVAIVMKLHEFAPVGGRPASGRDRRWLERFAEVRQGLNSRGRSHPGLLPLANLRFEVSRLLPAVYSEPDVTATPRALERKLLPHPGQEFRPGDSGGVVRAGFLMRVRAASRGVTVASMPAGRGLTAHAGKTPLQGGRQARRERPGADRGKRARSSRAAHQLGNRCGSAIGRAILNKLHFSSFRGYSKCRPSASLAS
jgi:hypothetical protein